MTNYCLHLSIISTKNKLDLINIALKHIEKLTSLFIYILLI